MTSVSLKCQIGSLKLAAPLLAASGTFGFGEEYADVVDFKSIGGFVTKGLSLLPRPGNAPPRICEVTSGMLNSIGLANPGLEVFLSQKLPYIAQMPCPALVNLYGESIEEFAQLAASLDSRPGVAGLEVNVSCPNVKAGGAAFGQDPQMVEKVTAAVRRATSLPVWVKLSPNVSDIVAIARAAENGGADAVSLINTLRGMAIDVHSRKPKLGFMSGGLSGPAIKPVGIYMVHQVSQAISLPVVGLGGIKSGEDVVEYLLAGARAVQVGTVNFYYPSAINLIVQELHDFCLEQGIKDVNELSGAMQKS